MSGKSRNQLPYNDKVVRAAKFAGGQERPIAGCPGLYLRIEPSEHAAFVFRYRSGGNTVRKKIGTRGLMTLADAKTAALALASSVDQGADPVAEERAQAATITLRALFAARERRDTGLASRTVANHRAALERDVFPALGDLPANQISADQIAALLTNIEDRSRHAAATCRSAIGSTYRWAQKRRMVAVNPCAGLGFTYKGDPRNRLLTDDELRTLWLAIDNGRQKESMRILLKLLILTGQRESEVAGARVGELRLLDSPPTWRIAATANKAGQRVEGRMKAKTEQIVVLSNQAARLFKQALAINCNSDHVFPRFEFGQRMRRYLHIAPDSVSEAMKKLYDNNGIPDAHAHDLRKSMATWLGERGEQPAVIDRVLHHSKKGVTDTHYNFALMLPQTGAAWQAWADHVDDLLA